MNARVLLTTYAANPAFGGGGPAWRVLQLLKAAAQARSRGYEMTAVFIDATLRTIDDLNAHSGRDRQFAGLPLVHYLWPTARYILRLWRTSVELRRAGRPLIVDAHDIPSAYLTRRVLPRARQVLTIHTIGDWVTSGFVQLRPQLQGTKTERLFRGLERSAVGQADVVVFPSRGAAALFGEAYRGLLEGKDVRVINAGLDQQAITAAAPDCSLLDHLSVGGRRLLLCVASHVREKGIDVLIEALGSLPEAGRREMAVVIVGRGPLTDDLRAMARARGLEGTLHFLSRVPDVAALMKAADIFVMTPRQSVFDVVFLEALAAGLPVIATRVGGIPEIFDDGSALLVPPEDPQAVASAIEELLKDEPKRESLAEAASRRLQEKFTLERMLEGYLAVYDSLAAGKEAQSLGADR